MQIDWSQREALYALLGCTFWLINAFVACTSQKSAR